MTNDNTEILIAPCGVDCTGCPELGGTCQGCLKLEGKTVWVSYIGQEICPLYDCPVNEHKYKTCAECKELPCKKFIDLRDPSMTDEVYEAGLKERLAVLRGL